MQIFLILKIPFYKLKSQYQFEKNLHLEELQIQGDEEFIFFTE